MPSFEIPDGPATIALKNQVVSGKNIRSGSTMFSVTNKVNQKLVGRVSVPPQGDAKAEWFEIQGEKERNFAASETQKINVNIKTSADVKPGDYKFRFRVVNVNDPDNDFTDSGVSTFNVPPVPVPTAPKKFPWWAVAVAVVMLLLVGGGVAYFAIPRTPEQVAVPDVRTKAFEAARQELLTAGFKVAEQPTKGEPTGQQPNTVTAQKPEQKADKGANVELIVDPGVTVPNNLVGRQPENLGNALSNFSVTFRTRPEQGTVGQIVDTDPPAGRVVAKNSQLIVFVRSVPCPVGRGPAVAALCRGVIDVPFLEFKNNPNVFKAVPAAPAAPGIFLKTNPK